MKLIENAYIEMRKRIWKESLPQAWDGKTEGRVSRLNEDKEETDIDNIHNHEENHQKVFSRSELIHATKHGFYPGKNGYLYRQDDQRQSNPHQRYGDSYSPIASIKKKPESFPIHNYDNELPHIEIAGKNARHWDRNGHLESVSELIHYYSDQEAETHRGMNNLLRKDFGNFKSDAEADEFIHHDPEHVIRSRIKEFSDLIRNAPHKPQSDFYVYTGLGKRTDIHEIMNGSTNTKAVHFPGFTSSSVDPRVTSNFTHPKPNTDSQIKFGARQEVEDVLKIKVPAGHQRGLYISHDSLNPVVGDEEKEYVLDKGHVIHVHPEPEYHVKDNFTITRLWHAHVNHDGE